MYDKSRSGGMADATVSKTVEGRLSCRFESDLRHHLPSSVVVAQGTLDPLGNPTVFIVTGDSSSGRTTDFGSVWPGSSPGSPANDLR